MDYRQLEVPITVPGYPDVLLRDLDDSQEMRHVMKDSLNRGLQKPVITTNPMYAEDLSAKVDMNLKGGMSLEAQQAMLEGVKNAGQYEKDSTAQAFRRLWLEVLNERPSPEDLMVFEYSGLTFDPRLGKIVTENPSNIFSVKSADLNDLFTKSAREYTKAMMFTPADLPRREQKFLTDDTINRLKAAISIAKSGKALATSLKSIFGALGPNHPRAAFIVGIADTLGNLLDAGVGAAGLIAFLEKTLRQTSLAAQGLFSPVRPAGF